MFLLIFEREILKYRIVQFEDCFISVLASTLVLYCTIVHGVDANHDGPIHNIYTKYFIQAAYLTRYVLFMKRKIWSNFIAKCDYHKLYALNFYP